MDNFHGRNACCSHKAFEQKAAFVWSRGWPRVILSQYSVIINIIIISSSSSIIITAMCLQK